MSSGLIHQVRPNSALLQTPHTLKVRCPVLRQGSVYGVRRSRTLVRYVATVQLTLTQSIL
jgi:hypothetical protein